MCTHTHTYASLMFVFHLAINRAAGTATAFIVVVIASILFSPHCSLSGSIVFIFCCSLTIADSLAHYYSCIHNVFVFASFFFIPLLVVWWVSVCAVLIGRFCKQIKHHILHNKTTHTVCVLLLFFSFLYTAVSHFMNGLMHCTVHLIVNLFISLLFLLLILVHLPGIGR